MEGCLEGWGQEVRQEIEPCLRPLVTFTEKLRLGWQWKLVPEEGGQELRAGPEEE